MANHTKPTAASRGIAARAWCTKKTENIEMDSRLAEEFAKIIEDFREALIWCSGSADFGQGRKAAIGWKRICEPLIAGE